MTRVVFVKNAGKYKKGQEVDLTPELAAFFVSKLKTAEYGGFDDLVDGSVENAEGDFSVASAPALRTRKPCTGETTAKRGRGRPKKASYLTREMKAND